MQNHFTEVCKLPEIHSAARATISPTAKTNCATKSSTPYAHSEALPNYLICKQ